MQKNFFNRLMRVFFTFLFGIVVMLGCDACEDDDNPIPPRQNYTLELSIYQHAPEVFVDSTIQIMGSLVDLYGEKLDNEKIYLSVVPDSVGNMTPSDFTRTDINDSLGFRDNVRFIARKPGTALITGRFYTQDQLAAQDTIHVLVKQRGNE